MGLFDIFKKNKENIEERFFADNFSFKSYIKYNNNTALKLSAVYAAVNIISNGVAQLPLEVFKSDQNGYIEKQLNHTLSYLLKKSPSDNITIFNFMKMVVNDVLLNGNAFALLLRDNRGNINQIKYINPNKVKIIYDEANEKVVYLVDKENKPVDGFDMLHFKMYTNDGVNGISTISYAANTLKYTTDAETHAGKFFKSGANLSGILKVAASLTNDQKTQIKNNWSEAFNSDTDGNSVAVLPTNIDYQPITIKPSDQQLLESRKYNIIEICRFFNISPVKLFDLSNSSYSSLEQTQLSFLNDTIKPFLKMIENEMNIKLFLPSQKNLFIQFDETKMLSADKQSLAEYYTKLLNNGILTVNEVRQQLNYNDVEGGNEHYMQLNMGTLKEINNRI